METIKDTLARLPGKARTAKRLTPEEYEAAIESRRSTGVCQLGCPVCGGIGFIRANPDAGILDPDYGKTKYCPNVDLVKLYGKDLGLVEDEIGSLAWKNLRNLGGIRSAIDAIKTALQDGYGWVTIWGNYGIGKSLLLRIAVAETLRSGKLGAYVRMADLLDDLRDAYDAHNPSDEAGARLAKWQNIPVLAIDEVNRINATPWAAERQFVLLDHRYQEGIREKSVTLLASNVSPMEIGGALGDRMLDGRFVCVHLDGNSNRPLMAKGQAY
jgi:hypothetical protein